MTTKSTISTFCRLKPTQNAIDYSTTSTSLTFSNQTHKFTHLFPPDASQETIFKTLANPCILTSLDGYNSTIFAYGQTGSGKTFTITGGPDSYADRGIIPRTLQEIFKSDCLKIELSYLEIYNEVVNDLLRVDSKVVVGEDGVRGCKRVAVRNETEALNVLFEGDTNRIIAATPSNPASSRSHCIFTIYIENETADEKIVKSKLTLVDLAGSERVWKTGIDGALLKEAKYINLSLHYLEQVIIALDEGKKYVPYRNSVMTTILKDSIGGNCKCVMIATLNLERGFEGESLSTCRFAERVQRIENSISKCEVVDDKLVIKRLEEEIRVLKAELVGGTSSGEGELDDEEIENIRVRVDNYINGSVDELCYSDYRKTKLSFEFLKSKLSPETSLTKFTPKPTNPSPPTPTELSQIEHLKKLAIHRDNEISILIQLISKLKSQSNQHPFTFEKTKAYHNFINTYPSSSTISSQTELLKTYYSTSKLKSNHLISLKNEIRLLQNESERKDRVAEYRMVMEEVRVLKSEIEHLQGVLKMARVRMVREFEEWYALRVDDGNVGPMEIGYLKCEGTKSKC
jgi:kinesin family member 6/9